MRRLDQVQSGGATAVRTASLASDDAEALAIAELRESLSR
jgi:hypothetical protein